MDRSLIIVLSINPKGPGFDPQFGNKNYEYISDFALLFSPGFIVNILPQLCTDHSTIVPRPSDSQGMSKPNLIYYSFLNTYN